MWRLFLSISHQHQNLICRDQNDAKFAHEYKTLGVDAIFILSAHFYEPIEAIQKLNNQKKNYARNVGMINRPPMDLARISLSPLTVTDQDTTYFYKMKKFISPKSLCSSAFFHLKSEADKPEDPKP